MQPREIKFELLKDLTFKIAYNEIDIHSRLNTFDSHIHRECEIYINLTGDVSFVVENSIYPIAPGNIIITRPGEYHHCVYHSSAIHKHFWILFSSEKMSELFPRFYDRAPGENNMLIFSGTQLKEVTDLCHNLHKNELHEIEALYLCCKLIHLINMADTPQKPTSLESHFIDLAIDYIHKNLSESIRVKDVAAAAYVSVNTLERHFKKILQMSPSEYAKKRRLAHAAVLLQNGALVTYACEQSGFVDCSKFIIMFKKHYGLTPFKYKKLFENNPVGKNPKPS